MFGHKFEVSRGVWVEMLQKAAGSHEKPTGEVWAEEKQLGDTGLCADSYQSVGGHGRARSAENWGLSLKGHQPRRRPSRAPGWGASPLILVSV